MFRVSCLLAAAFVAVTAYGWSSEDRIATKGRSASVSESMWHPGVDALINHRLREDGYQWWMSECPPAPYRYELNIQTVADVQELINLLAAMTVDDPAILLEPAQPKPADAPKAGVVTPSELQILKPGAELPIRGGRVGPKMGAVFYLADVEGYKQWYDRLPFNDDGQRIWGVHTFDEIKLPRVASLELYIDHPAVDMDRLTIPTKIDLLPSYNDSYRRNNADNPSVQRIEALVAIHRMKQGDKEPHPTALETPKP